MTTAACKSIAHLRNDAEVTIDWFVSDVLLGPVVKESRSDLHPNVNKRSWLIGWWMVG